MPYWPYRPWLVQRFGNRKDLKILEIGVDKGQMLIPLASDLLKHGSRFFMAGVDVRFDDGVVDKLKELATRVSYGQLVQYDIENSLEWMPKCKIKFDIIMIDGDHNYFTVAQELVHLNRMLKPEGIALVDDYQGNRWATKDLYYSTRESHEGIKDATPFHKTDKQGVKAAVDDYLEDNPDWAIARPVGCDAVLLTREANKKAMEL